ncbi:MAG: hypothetical protein JWM32_2796 [Verrucomicrobia bacterium]|nr:hypothetical protein [Verrucomicrobiota bacterium]
MNAKSTALKPTANSATELQGKILASHHTPTISDPGAYKQLRETHAEHERITNVLGQVAFFAVLFGGAIPIASIRTFALSLSAVGFFFACCYLFQTIKDEHFLYRMNPNRPDEQSDEASDA